MKLIAQPTEQSNGCPHSIRLFNRERIDIGANHPPRGDIRVTAHVPAKACLGLDSGWTRFADEDIRDALSAEPAPRRRKTPMSHLALVSPKLPAVPSPADQSAHDIRNALTTVGLHLDTLERLAGPPGQKGGE